MASLLQWIPDSLYNYSLAAVVSYRHVYIKDFAVMEKNMLFDVCYKMYQQGLLNELRKLFSDLTFFCRLLSVGDKQYLLHHSFQALVDIDLGITKELANAYNKYVNEWPLPDEEKSAAIHMGFLLGNFLSDAGWYTESESVFSNVSGLTNHWSDENPQNLELYLESQRCLLHVRTAYCKFNEAENTLRESLLLVNKIHESKSTYNLTGLYQEFASFFFSLSNYNQAYHWIIEALKELRNCKSIKIVVAVLRQASKICVVKKEFPRARFLIQQAFYLANEYFGIQHPVMADFFIDYGFYLLNIDSVHHSITVYQAALETRQCVFGGNNLLLAIAHEELAYSLYVHEYSTGRFKQASDHAEKANKLMSLLLPQDHLLLGSLKRVKALILEEIAMDYQDRSMEKHLLLESLELHTAALRLAQKTFGEMNVLTAKHYGNLGRLYQSMEKFEKAKEMHLKAIRIKEQLLGSNDYEVALSIGHLASLYNYDLELYSEAEKLHLRSIAIGKSLFGPAYSGLEYDYLGLVRIYNSQENFTLARTYSVILDQWRELRLRTLEAEREISPLAIQVEPCPLDQIYLHFSNLKCNN